MLTDHFPCDHCHPNDINYGPYAHEKSRLKAAWVNHRHSSAGK